MGHRVYLENSFIEPSEELLLGRVGAPTKNFFSGIAMSATAIASTPWEVAFSVWLTESSDFFNGFSLNFIHANWQRDHLDSQIDFVMRVALGAMKRVGWPEPPRDEKSVYLLDYASAVLLRWANELTIDALTMMPEDPIRWTYPGEQWVWSRSALNEDPPTEATWKHEAERCGKHGLYFIPERLQCFHCLWRSELGRQS